ncbi:transporter, SSS family [Filimonas lacunae]|uniref:Transporter, SSS family n=1 Tax=Filimonas lacunae TaxID=477680 RepID=A0A173MLM4_9BACT|nr:sodium:solute symporter [Filimonas lacunae]BAV08542.1 sodium iodide symporter [Filimonas lacunae]SIS56683.1 transporter, SSS family [Filimonas lacunae]
MSVADWIVLTVALAGIVVYGLYKSRTDKNLEGYFLSNNSMPWYMVLLSIMGTQASAITFLSAPGQAFTDGMRFVQYYFGLPLAMIILCITFVPAFSKLRVFTAYEFLEQRFDKKTRYFTSALFLLSRGLSTGISIYAPSIILSSLLGWNIYWTNIAMGGMLIIYTVSGGAKAVAYTQQLQMLVIFLGMFVAAYMLVHYLPENVGVVDALKVGGMAGKMNVITSGITSDGHFNWKDRYNIISGLIGGFFLALSYFGTDQSQVGRYLTAKNDTESKLGLLLNGLVKVPMQFFVLLIGVLLFAFYQFNPQPLFFNNAVNSRVYKTAYADSLKKTEATYSIVMQRQQQQVVQWLQADKAGNAEQAAQYKGQIQQSLAQGNTLKQQYKQYLQKADSSIDVNDTNYIFLKFVVDYLPKGLVGLLIAVIFLAAWGSIAAALNSLASCTMIDFVCRKSRKEINECGAEDRLKQYQSSKWITMVWGLFSIAVAGFANRMGSLIEAVNILGSLFYGVILGIFLVAFYCKSMKSTAVFTGALLAQVVVILLFVLDRYNIIGIGFLWFNVIGALLVVMLGWLIHALLPAKTV